MHKPKVLVTVQRPLYAELTTKQSRAKLQQLAGELVVNESDDAWSQEDVIARIDGSEAVINSWGSCKYDEQILDAAPNLRIICYAAGSIRRMAPAVVFDRGIRVTHAAQVIAEAVAEFTLATVLTLLRRIPEHSKAMGSKDWNDNQTRKPLPRGRRLYRKRYGIVGASMVARSLIPLLKPFGVEIVVYDPYLSHRQAKDLGVAKAELTDLMASCDVISLHAPTLPETKQMIGAALLETIRDDAVFVNNARAWLVDSKALLAELKKERFDAALDVFDDEPLAENSPLRRLDRTILTPHIAGATMESRSNLIGSMVNELERFLLARPLLYEISQENGLTGHDPMLEPISTRCPTRLSGISSFQGNQQPDHKYRQTSGIRSDIARSYLSKGERLALYASLA